MDVQEIIEEVCDRIRTHEIEIGSGAAGYHFVRIWPDGSVTDGIEPSYTVPESEYFGQPGAPLTVWSQQASGEGLPRDCWEWNSLDRVADRHSWHSELLSRAIEESVNYHDLLTHGREIEFCTPDGPEPETLFVFYDVDAKGWFFHDYTPHEWEDPETPELIEAITEYYKNAD